MLSKMQQTNSLVLSVFGQGSVVSAATQVLLNKQLSFTFQPYARFSGFVPTDLRSVKFKALVANEHIFPTNAFWFPTELANKHIFPTEAFWFPTEFNNVKSSREPKGVSSK